MSVIERWEKTSPLTMKTAEILALVQPVLEHDARIILAYQFGSTLTQEHPRADIDLAFLTAPDFQWEDYYGLHGSLTETIHSDRLDLLWLNHSEPIITFRIIREGRALFYRSAGEINDFKLKAKKRYYDYCLYLGKHRRFRERDGTLHRHRENICFPFLSPEKRNLLFARATRTVKWFFPSPYNHYSLLFADTGQPY